MTVQIFRFRDLGNWHTKICDFLDRQDTSHPFQFPLWSRRGSLFALIQGDAEIRWYACAGIQYPLGRCFPCIRSVIINRGPVCDDPECWRTGLSEFLQCLKNEFAYVDVSPDHVSLPSDGVCLEKNRYSLRIDLTRDAESLLSSFRKVARYEVRRAERVGLEVGLATAEPETEAFLNLYARMAERKHFTADAASHMRDIIQWLQNEPERGALMLAKYEEAVLGGAVMVRSGRRCWYVWGASRKHTSFSSGHLLQWRAMLWAKTHGCTEYDFGGYTPGATSGPAWFKQGFGGSTVQFVPARREILKPRLYRLLQVMGRN
jgi:hypothetical protein